MSKRTRDLTGEEKKLWRRVAAQVKPRRAQSEETPQDPVERVRTSPPHLKPATKTIARTPVKTAAPLADRGAEKRVRRGKVEIGATLDLHGHTQETARTALARFLRAAHARGDATVIVVTGVGRAGEGVLKRRVPEWLAERDLRALTSGFARAHRAHGGAGALYVFLKRSRANE